VARFRRDGCLFLDPLLQRPIQRLVTFADLDLCVVNVRQHLAGVAHVELLTAARHFMK
jgi:hypothetical protein